MGNFVRRNQKVNFMKVGVGGSFKRMTNFTALSEEKNPIEYSRQYVDNSFETTDVVGMSSSMSFALDQKPGDEVHEVIVDIFDKEKLGSDAVIEILSVDFSKPVAEHSDPVGSVAYEARLRSFSVIPESEGGEMEVYSYEGSLRANGQTKHGKAVFTDELAITEQIDCTFV